MISLRTRKEKGTGERIFASNLQLCEEEEDRMERQSRAGQQVRSGQGGARQRVE